MAQERRNGMVIPDFLPGSVTGVLPEIWCRAEFLCRHMTGEFNGSWCAMTVSLQVIR